MDRISQAKKVLQQAEESLVELANSAAAKRDYADATAIIEMARALAQIGQRPAARGGEAALVASSVSNGHRGATGSGTASSRAARKTRTRRSGKKAGYPKFFRDGDNLVRVAWSKAKKAPYEHRASKGVLLALVQKLCRIAREQKRFVVDDVLPLSDPADGSDIPNYQAYICIGWLRTTHMLEQHGRQGYSVSNTDSLEVQAEEQWQMVPER